ncbi:MAG: hypothetical protein RJA70_1194 [Pseudomonadota bacterium]|jgi:hypothetical protein
MPAQTEFFREFSRLRRVIRRARLQRAGLSGTTSGLLLALPLAATAWWYGNDALRFGALGLGLVGAATFAFRAERRGLSDEEVALFLDSRLATKAEITTALSPERATELHELVRSRATQLLSAARTEQVRPTIYMRFHALAVFGVIGIFGLGWLKSPGLADATPAPPARPLSVVGLSGFENLTKLDQLRASDPEQAERLKALAEAARRLQKSLAQGLPDRDALSEIAKLRDGIHSELGELGNSENRAGLSAAVEALRRVDATKKAAQALGDGDLVRFDSEMKKVAQAAEQQDRDKAKEALRQAIAAAKQKGAKSLSRELAEQEQQLDARSHAAELFKQLDAALDEKRREGKLPESAPSAEAPSKDAANLGKALEDALKQLTPEERRRVAERMKQGIEDGSFDFDPQAQAKMEQMAEQLSTPEGQQKLAESLKRLAQPSAGAERQQGLRDGLKGLGQAQRELSGVPIPLGRSGGGLPQAGDGSAEGNAPRAGRGGDRGNHDGKTERVHGESLRAKSEPALDLSRPLLGASQGRTPARAGETANARGSGALEAAKAGELLGVDRAPIPAEYREQVSRYFSPE